MPRQTNTETLGVQLIEVLRRDLLAGRFPPGSPLRLVALSQQFGTSVSVVREALLRLSEQGLVTLTPNAGFRVQAVSKSDLDDLTDLRVMIECEALRRAIAEGDAEWEAGVLAAHHLLERAPVLDEGERGTSEEWSAAHARFHAALIAACGSPRLIGIAGSLRDSAELYRQLSTEASIGGARDVPGEHRRMLELALARDADAAVALLETHLRTTAELIQPIVERLEIDGAPAPGPR
ncbi:GntR family transcriptional regulator [Leifsonia sp. EB34]|uniref:GntR family transcriptional regulator n=1 Tax=Leifsonia sp. EB34 TaxID=3156303 RepID=UPI00351769D5